MEAVLLRMKRISNFANMAAEEKGKKWVPDSEHC